ncbi:MAG: efflux RND transporter periplasmic adaptor subunit [Betaproteobacteria bacterium]|nr:efflux RND transporter periplasmic adaptor subunit [Betaproteobacteria bacterium]
MIERPKRQLSKRVSSKRSISVRLIRIGVVVLFLLVCGIAFAVFHTLGSSPAANGARWLAVQPQLLENRLGLVGRIEPAARLLITAPFEGVIKELAVSEGNRVEEGQILLTIGTAQLEIQIRQAYAELLKAQSNVEKMSDWENSDEVARARRSLTNMEMSMNNTKARLKETRHLFERGIVARQEVEELEERLNSLELELAASQSELQAARNKGQGENRQIAELELANITARTKALQTLFKQHELYAPFAGSIQYPKKATEDSENSIPIQVGQPVRQGMPLLELTNMERIGAAARVEEADLHQLAEKMPVEVTGEGFEGIMLNGRIVNISSQGKKSDAFSSSTTYDVAVAINPLSPEEKARVRIGMSARLSVVIYRQENGFALPPEAVRHDENGQPFVTYRQSMNDKPKRVAVKTGRPFPQGVEVFGVEPGYVELPANKQ